VWRIADLCRQSVIRHTQDVNAVREAARTISRLKLWVAEFRRTNDIEAIPANPMSQLCTNRFCAARGTEFCKSWKH
jgi:isopentenyl phosphate kinase